MDRSNFRRLLKKVRGRRASGGTATEKKVRAEEPAD